MTNTPTAPIHATCVAIAHRGVVLRGPSGAGKSDLALRLIDRGAVLVGDDYIHLQAQGDHLIARPAANLSGLIEMRGVGVIKRPYLSACAVSLVVDLVLRDEVPRMPDQAKIMLFGVSVNYLRLHAFDLATVLKIEWSLAELILGEGVQI